MTQENGRCPVCRAAFRQSLDCHRCGANLKALMTLSARAYLLREDSRRQLAAGHFEQALQLAEQAQRLHATGPGSGLSKLARLSLKLKTPSIVNTSIFFVPSIDSALTDS